MDESNHEPICKCGGKAAQSGVPTKSCGCWKEISVIERSTSFRQTRRGSRHDSFYSRSVRTAQFLKIPAEYPSGTRPR